MRAAGKGIGVLRARLAAAWFALTLVGQASVPARAPAEEAQNNWLKTNENGEPCEVVLTDGTVLKLDTYGDDYDAYEYHPPITADKGKVLIDYNKMNRDGVSGGGIHLDLKHKKMYWGEMPYSTHAGSSILRANLNGSNIETVVDRHPLRPAAHALDPEADKIYWVNSGSGNGEGISIECANLNGSRPKVIVRRLAQPAGIAVDPVSKKLYYFNDNDLIASTLNGKDETKLLVDRLHYGEMLVDPTSQTLYWGSGGEQVRRAKTDGTEVGDAVNVGQAFAVIRHIALDAANGKIYWTNESAKGYIRRANLDGSQVEDVVINIEIPTGVALDVDHQTVYWTESSAGDKGLGNVRICRAPLRPLPSSKKLPAPPWVSRISPQRCGPGSEIVVSGGHLKNTTEVWFVDDGTGERIRAKFTLSADDTLSIIVPQMSSRCRNPLLLVRGPGGVTAALPRSVRVAHHDAVDRFRANDRFAWLAPAGGVLGIDRGAVIAFRGASVTGGDNGENTFLLKNGAAMHHRGTPDNVIYFEPFALISERQPAPQGTNFVGVGAVRASFIEPPFEYRGKE